MDLCRGLFCHYCLFSWAHEGKKMPTRTPKRRSRRQETIKAHLPMPEEDGKAITTYDEECVPKEKR